MVPESDNKEVRMENTESGGPEQTAELHNDPQRRESLEENLEKLAALNLGNDMSLQPRYSTAVIRLVSALAGIGALVLIYFITKLFI